jgi:ferredoxin
VKITVDRLLCEANGICEDLAPAVFSLDHSDDLQLLVTEVPAELLDDVEAAVNSCPKQALALEYS